VKYSAGIFTPFLVIRPIVSKRLTEGKELVMTIELKKVSKDEILKHIEFHGCFCFEPSCWSDETYAALTELEASGKIRRATKEEYPMNTEYIYLRGKGLIVKIT
jgi:hypothetical protein